MNEIDYSQQTSIKYRKKLGQFFTPDIVANLMINWITLEKPKKILDPAFGLGVFYDVISNKYMNDDLLYTGYEIDNHILSFLDNNSRDNLKIINGDYLQARLNEYDAIICNPPYMRFQKFLNRHDILPLIEEVIGKKLVGYSNISSIFLVKALQELKNNGRLAFIMPFEFFNTGYGEEIKKSLLENNLLKQIVIFSNEKEIFPDATTTVCIIFCKNDKKNDGVKITRINSNDEIVLVDDIEQRYEHHISSEQLPYNSKWTPILSSLYQEQNIPKSFIPLSFYGRFKRGIATGANKFFSLSQSDINKLDLGSTNYTKCITKSPQIKKAVFDEVDFEVLSENNKPVYCLNVQEHGKKEIRSYIKQGEELGYHKRYLTRTRTPWYKVEFREPSPILVGVFNRGRLKIVRNLTFATNFTCFHSFYPNIFGAKYIDKLFVYLLSDIGQKILKINKRSYGANLDKFEPGDLNECMCPNQTQFDTIDDSQVLSIMNIAKRDGPKAIKLCNKLMENVLLGH